MNQGKEERTIQIILNGRLDSRAEQSDIVSIENLPIETERVHLAYLQKQKNSHI